MRLAVKIVGIFLMPAALNGCAVFHRNGRHLSQWAIEKYWSAGPTKRVARPEAGAKNSAAMKQPISPESARPPEPAPSAALEANQHSVAAIPSIALTGLLDAIAIRPILSIPAAVHVPGTAGHATGLLVSATIVLNFLSPLVTVLTFVAALPVAEIGYILIPGLPVRDRNG